MRTVVALLCRGCARARCSARGAVVPHEVVPAAFARACVLAAACDEVLHSLGVGVGPSGGSGFDRRYRQGGRDLHLAPTLQNKI